MRIRAHLALAASLLLFFHAAGCAVGSTADDATQAAPPATGGNGEDDASPPEQLTSTEAGLPDSAPPSTGDTDGSTDAGAGDSGAPDGGSDASSASCASSNACAAATVVPQLSADTGADTRTAQGSTSEWLQVLATENDGSILGHDLRIKATLASPPGANFDLFLYRGGDAPALACGLAPVSSSSLTSGTDTATDLWTDNPNHTDSKIVSIEVRYVSGACDPSAKWTLTLTGNTN